MNYLHRWDEQEMLQQENAASLNVSGCKGCLVCQYCRGHPVTGLKDSGMQHHTTQHLKCPRCLLIVHRSSVSCNSLWNSVLHTHGTTVKYFSQIIATVVTWCVCYNRHMSLKHTRGHNYLSASSQRACRETVISSALSWLWSGGWLQIQTVFYHIKYKLGHPSTVEVHYW